VVVVVGSSVVVIVVAEVVLVVVVGSSIVVAIVVGSSVVVAVVVLVVVGSSVVVAVVIIVVVGCWHSLLIHCCEPLHEGQQKSGSHVIRETVSSGNEQSGGVPPAKRVSTEIPPVKVVFNERISKHAEYPRMNAKRLPNDDKAGIEMDSRLPPSISNTIPSPTDVKVGSETKANWLLRLISNERPPKDLKDDSET
jgi:hypothetical protein